MSRECENAEHECSAKRKQLRGTLNSLCKEALDAEHDTNVRCNAKGHHCSCSYIPNLSKFAGDASDAQLHQILTWTSLITQPWRGPPFRFQRRHDLLSANWTQGMIQPATQPLCHHYAITMPLCHYAISTRPLDLNGFNAFTFALPRTSHARHRSALLIFGTMMALRRLGWLEQFCATSSRKKTAQRSLPC